MLINTGNISRKVLSKVLRSFVKNFERLQREKRAENFLVSIWNHYDSCADYLDGITDTRIFGGNIMEQKEFVFQAL